MSDTGMSLEGKRVVVIGGSSGIGFAVAELATKQGANVVLASRSEANIALALHRLVGAEGLKIDLRDEQSVVRFFDTIGPFDHLVLTAGDWDSSSLFTPTANLDLTLARANLDVRFWGVLAAVKYSLPTISQNGSITLTGGMLVHRPRKNAPLATAFGGAIEHLARGMAIDLAPIRVNAVSPGLVLTEPVKQMPEPMVQSMVSPLPIPRTATPAEAAKAYVYAMLNTYVTGQILPVDGGGLLV